MKTGRTGNNGRYIEYKDIQRDCLYWQDTHNNKYIITTGSTLNIESLTKELSVGIFWAHEDRAFPQSISITSRMQDGLQQSSHNIGSRNRAIIN